MSIPVVYEPTPDEKLKLIDSVANEYYLPKTFEVRGDPVQKKSSLMDVAFAHGARDVSDGMVRQRVIEVSGRIWGYTDAEFNQKWDELAKELKKENFIIQDKDRQINISKTATVTKRDTLKADIRFADVTINFLALDPFWYSKTAKQKEFTITVSPKNFQFDVGGNVETSPLIKIENNENNTDFTLENTTDGEREFRIQDSGALNGTEIEIDCAAGTVKRDGTDIISSFSGLFLRLLGGRENKFKYTGADCKITFQYKEAYL